MEKTNKHPKTEMLNYGDRWNRVHRYSTGRHGRIWHFTVYCPVCFGRKFPLSNTSKGKVFYCTGNMPVETWRDPETNQLVTFKEIVA